MADTENFFGKGNKEKRVQKRLARRAERKRRGAERLDARQGITSEHRKKMQEVELEKVKAEVKQDEAVANIAATLQPTQSTPPPKKSMGWLWLLLLLLLLAVVALFFIL